MQPPAVSRWIATVTALGLVALAGSLWSAAGTSGNRGVAFALALGVTVSTATPIRYRFRGETHGLTLDQAMTIALLFAVPAAWVPLTVIAAVVLGHLLRGTELHKLVFNAGIVAMSTGAASLVYGLVGGWPDPGLSGRAILAAVSALITMEVVGQVVMAELFRRFGQGSIATLIRGLLTVQRFTIPGGLAVGVLLGWLASTSTIGAVIGALGVVVLYVSYRTMIGAEQQRLRVQRLREVSHALVGASRSIDSFDEALAAMARLFTAERAELLMVGDNPLHRLVLADGSLDRTAVASTAVLELVGGQPLPNQATLGVVLERDGRLLGALALHDPAGLEPWDQADRNVLGGLADEVVVALENAELVEELAAERAELVAQSALLGGILDAASDGIAMIDPDGVIQSWNPAMGAIAGVPAGQAIGELLIEVVELEDEEGTVVRIDLPDPRDLAGGPIARTWRIHRNLGDVRFVRVVVSPVRHRGRHGLVLVARDVTATREVDRLKADFIATVSHELRTPLTPLGGNLDLLLRHGDRIDDERRTAMLQSMRRQMERLEALVDNLLTVAEVDRDLVDITYEPVSIGSIITNVVANAGTDRVTVVSGGDIQALGDRDAIHRVLHALVGNALQHTDGPVRIRTAWARRTAIIAVEDHGPGIPVADQEAIFERFARLGATEHHHRGSGLGLPIARALARRLGGDVKVASTPGSGATFTFTLPMAGAPRGLDPLTAERPAASVGRSMLDDDRGQAVDRG